LSAKSLRRGLFIRLLVVLAALGGHGVAGELDLKRLAYDGEYPSSSSGESFAIELLSWRNPLDGERTYGALLKPKGRSSRLPIVVVSDPYNVYPETGDAVDVRWAKAVDGREEGEPLPDSDMEVESGVPVRIPVGRRPLENVAEGMEWYLNNGYALLYAFGRFYKADSALNDAYDVLGAIKVAESLPGIDGARIGVTGASWGAFSSIYAVSRAETPVQVAAVVGVFAPVDAPTLSDFINGFIPARFSGEDLEFYRSFFYSYWDRLLKSSKEPFERGAPEWEFATFDYAAENVRCPVLLICGSDDSMVPCGQSVTLTQKLLKAGKPAWCMVYDNGPPPWEERPLSHGMGEGNSGISVEALARNFFLKYMPPDVGEVEVEMRWEEVLSFLESMGQHVEAHPEDQRNMIEFLKEAMNPIVSYRVADMPEASGKGAEVFSRGLNELMRTETWSAETIGGRISREGFPVIPPREGRPVGSGAPRRRAEGRQTKSE